MLAFEFRKVYNNNAVSRRFLPQFPSQNMCKYYLTTDKSLSDIRMTFLALILL